jgi:ATP-dependent DNA helicase RecG
MRPSILDPLFAPASTLPGVGERIRPLLDRLLGNPEHPARILDLLFHLPHASVSREVKGGIAEAPAGERVTLQVRVVEHRPPPPGRQKAPYKVLVKDDSADLTLVFFHAGKARMEKMLPIGATRLVSGTIEHWDGMRQMVHPERVVDSRAGALSEGALPEIEAVYGQTEGLTSRLIARFIHAALARVPALPEWQDETLLTREHFPPFREALTHLHHPDTAQALKPEVLAKDASRRRLAYDELFASQLALALVRLKMHRRSGRRHIGDGRLIEAAKARLPFTLTAAQEQALKEIRHDLASPRRMLRLLQGDVGSGKTVVALLAMLGAVEAGRQSALMVPTEILARQHFERLRPLVEGLGLRIGLLTGREKGDDRRYVLAALQEGAIDIAIGTHALFQDKVFFRDLGVAVIDEQHRFGVQQRLALGSKGEGVDSLVMTATPIPRTLALANFGDMDISVLDSKPAGRQPITTRLIALDRLEDVTQSLHRALANGDSVYWICPLVNESEAVDLAAAQDRFAELQKRFGETVGLLHGQMRGREKDAAMEAFVSGRTRILVSTTVIEVGIDVPQASIMVIEHAERFGLAQLHQLRGRIGRGMAASICLLLYKGPLGPIAKARLEILRESEDGFRIAEEDLRLRGEGEILGRRQSGLPDFRLARLEYDADLLSIARNDARLLLERDPDLTSPRAEAARLLLYLFERDAAVRLLKAG